MNPYTIILENFPHCEECSEQSFLSQFHEYRKIDLKAYWKLEWAVIQLTSAPVESPRDHYWPVFRIFSCLCTLFQEHERDNYYGIINFDGWFMRGLKDRSTAVFEGYFKGQIPDMPDRPEFANPYLNKSRLLASQKEIEISLALASAANADHPNSPYEEEGVELGIHAHCMEIIYKNLSLEMQWSEQSFLGILHERRMLDIDSYWKLEWAILWLTMNLGHRPSPHCWTVHLLFTQTTNMLYAHIDPDDEFEISEVSKERVYAFLKRINAVFEGFFAGKAPIIDDRFGERNPLLDQEICT